MTSLAHRLLTFDELYTEIEALPEGMTGEILGPGELRVMSRPAGRHRFGAQRISHALRGSNFILGGSGWWIEVEAELRLPDDRLYVPDLCGWRIEGIPPFIEENPITVMPDWACEILSRDTQRADRARKLPHYARAGIGHVWIVDPAARSIEVYETRGRLPVLVETATNDATAVLPPFSLPIDLASLWLPLPKGKD